MLLLLWQGGNSGARERPLSPEPGANSGKSLTSYAPSENTVSQKYPFHSRAMHLVGDQ